ncbi:MAG: hydro-lyase, Fe-S type, tartrate/fumarate subfamily, alpha subunit [Desulfomicrobiaceae bacterium]|jgi:fumarate hydratase subunit alpha|nr:fumarate hydratase [Desulfomicrobiaceae bacterium]MBZ4648230.1 hydro-lyase, Fe-S type, tartrate/fumarate subfamily, alpha subunit [Desulfomicrobiaceae bacterium]MBZ4686124.1 hydro-lyase, Fe-S type, tartrate/fumarate subfamily, alpha subunit [Desulfomicrobiaceae bacterium]MDK2873127.1 fumarate hydratase subunit alpha [Desulfomicrobiaceae bacterium]
MKSIKAQEIHDAVRRMIMDACRILPDDVYQAFLRARDAEELDSAKEVLTQLIDNADLARSTELALCQDTGAAVFFVDYGDDVRIDGGHLEEILNAAMVEAYDKGFLRKSMCHPLTRKNTGDNTPAIIHTHVVPGETLRIRFMAKGGGSENMSRIAMLKPAQGWKGIKEFVVRTIAEAGPNPCPPTIVGVGIGGTFDLAPALAKKALFRPIGERNPNPEVAALEEELLSAINDLGIGPMGLGGKTTSLDVKVEMHPCHIASLPVAVNVQCHSSRTKEVVF